MYEPMDRLQARLALPAEKQEALYALLAQIDAVKHSWKVTASLKPRVVQRLTQSVIITSTGASNRIEGNLLSDKEVESLYRTLRVQPLQTRDEQEVGGYLEAIELVFSHFAELKISESTILHLHSLMLRHSARDERHRGRYTFSSNRVEAKDAAGKVIGVIFDPTPPHLVAKEMQELIAWYQAALDGGVKHPLLLVANFIFEFLAIHPFQDGNGRISRLLTNTMLLQQGYPFSALVSHERLIEQRKADYYLALTRPKSHGRPSGRTSRRGCSSSCRLWPSRLRWPSMCSFRTTGRRCFPTTSNGCWTGRGHRSGVRSHGLTLSRL